MTEPVDPNATGTKSPLEQLRDIFARIDEKQTNSRVPPGLMEMLLDATGIPYPRSITALRTELGKESDRGCAILGAAYLDLQLLEVLRASLVDDKNVFEALTDEGALSAFSAKIDACYLFGLISRHARNLLHQIRKIRNDFAHDVDVSFDTPLIKSRCESLPPDPMGRQQSARERFVTNMFGLMAPLHHAQLTATRPAPKEEISLDKDEMREHFRGWLELIGATLAAGATPASTLDGGTAPQTAPVAKGSDSNSEA